jgi:hypothetical protein
MGQPQGQRTNALLGQSVDKFSPATPLNEYQYDPMLSPKQNREEAAKVNTQNRTNMNNAKNSFSLLKSAADTLASGAPSSGRLQNALTGANEFFGESTPASKADAVMSIYGTKLTQQVPRFEGPQSDKDTALYQSAAGDLGNANKPIATRLAAIQTMVELNQKYYPNADWASIKTEVINPAAPTSNATSKITPSVWGKAKVVEK